jgi:hypothetical protein
VDIATTAGEKGAKSGEVRKKDMAWNVLPIKE